MVEVTREKFIEELTKTLADRAHQKETKKLKRKKPDPQFHLSLQ